MKTRLPDILIKARINIPANRDIPPGEPFGAFLIRCPTGAVLKIIAGAGDEDAFRRLGFPLPAFDHVSVSIHEQERCPTWDEMNWVKDQFFEPEECAIQYHPPKSQYVNRHEFVLHIWKPIGVEIPLPPRNAV